VLIDSLSFSTSPWSTKRHSQVECQSWRCESLVITACWSVKGGSGTTVIAAALGALAARQGSTGALLADLAGDIPALLGMRNDGPGLLDWLLAGDEVPSDALSRLEISGPGGIDVLPSGRLDGRADEADLQGRSEVLAALLAVDPRQVVVDCGTQPTGAALTLAAAAPISLLVLRPCYLALCKALAAPVRPTGVVLVTEPDRSLGRHDVEGALGVPVWAEVMIDPAVARAVDAGVLSSRLPRSLERALRHAA